MDLKWYRGEAGFEPPLVDEQASENVTIVRRNIEKIEKTDTMGEEERKYDAWVYDEAMPTKQEYAIWKMEQDNQAAITQLQLALAEAVEAML